MKATLPDFKSIDEIEEILSARLRSHYTGAK
jgi:hypothetical protein